MSGITRAMGAMHRSQHGDRRVRRTHQALSQALGALIEERSYDEISVRDILERANVGRSTFYTHFRDKDALLFHGILDMVEAGRPRAFPPEASLADRTLWFGLPILAHIDRHRRAGGGFMGTRGRATLHRHLRRALTDFLATDLEAALRSGQSARVPPRLATRHVVSTFIQVLDWWVESRSTLTPTEADALFRRLAAPALITAPRSAPPPASATPTAARR